MGFNLFTLIVKFNIRDNAHPLSRSWNSSSDARIGSMTCCSYHTHKSVYQYISLFFVLLLARLSFVANSLERGVYFYTTVSFYSVSHSRVTFPSSSKNRCGSMWLEFITAPVNIRLSNVDLSPDKRSLVVTRILAYSPMCTKRRSNCDFVPANHAILATTDCVQLRGADV